MQLDYHPIPIDLIMHNQVKHKDKFKNERHGALANAPGLAFSQNYVSEVFNLNLLRRHLEFQLRVYVAYRRNEPYMS
jgi:hypothetical protein